ncbi:TetR/AcrR family transcriptional regulator [Maribellus maritimus]|uniref:TetR/AcrR family transcriptional regulator n=1 Tax=Maribellus maritimus TaxID=2870838 RepID=UPI001EEB9349|nr:TetR/AcrR family transcriptional regulator [Maribellus maritimus]MCG6190269.1 TetR/AcrR family transcriptional regulator [Maribellus maritimus]
MQIQKEDIRKIILKAARKEFIENGFKDASMRSIAKNAGVGLSNIYNYFRNKDEIFREVLSGLLHAIDSAMKEHNNPDYISIDIFSSEEYMRRQIDMFVELIENHKEDFNLLLFKASGSSLENFRNEIIDTHTETGIEYIALMKQKYPEINSRVSNFFIHIMSSWWISIVAELVMHDLSHNELEEFIREYMEFGTAGWKKVMRVENYFFEQI